ncbi:CinA-like protein [Bienertia sinuspersici]
MAMRKFFNELRGITVKEVPDKVKPMLSLSYLKESFAKGIDNYHAKHIQTDSIMPLYHVCFGGMIFSYLVALPEERRHLEHAQQHGH